MKNEINELLTTALAAPLTETLAKALQDAVAELKGYIDKVMVEHDTERLLSVDEASAFLGLPKSSIYKLTCKKQFR